MADSAVSSQTRWLARPFVLIGRGVYAGLDGLEGGARFLGGLTVLLGQTLWWTLAATYRRDVKFRRESVFAQMVRVGYRSIPIIVLVQVFIGIILALQMAPTLKDYGQLDKVANIIAVAVFRELGPLITAVVLSGFAGASIAAEIGAMVEAEEVKALRAHALNPINFLVVPRFVATVFMLVCLAVISDVVGIIGGAGTSILMLGIDPHVYLQNTQDALVVRDFITGLVKAGVFGLLISLIACLKGLRVSGGAVGVGRATTDTVVLSIVSLIGTDCLFTAAFYVLGW
ncbi:MAG: ABC transporter permease [Phycisphaerae bacterium]|nr:ABC transporter permease [Phycisphaerae bacterium]